VLAVTSQHGRPDSLHQRTDTAVVDGTATFAYKRWEGLQMNSATLVEPDPVRLAGIDLGEYRHICSFFDSEEQEREILAPFIREGIDRGEKSFHIIEPSNRANYVKRLVADGIDVVGATERGQLDLRGSDDAYLRPGYFDQDAMLDLLDDALKTAVIQGFPRTRLLARMEWALEDRPGVRSLIEYEARVNDIMTEHRDIVICMYDIRRFSGSVVVDVLRSHPIVLVNGTVLTNPFFVPPDELLSERRESHTTQPADR
jgi:hypothetical protein